MYKSEKTFGLFDTPLNKKIIKKLENTGHSVFALPQNTIQIVEIEMLSDNESPLNPAYFDWIIFPDVFSVDVFLRVLEMNRFDLFELDNLRVCAAGEAVADRLRFVQLHADIISNNHNASETFADIKNYLSNENDLAGLKVLIVKEANEFLKITDLLKTVNAQPTELNIYRTLFDINIPKLKTLVIGGAFDEFIFAAPDEVFALSKVFYPVALADIFSDIPVVATNEITFQTLFEFALKPTFYK